MSLPGGRTRHVWPFDIGIVGTGIVGAHQMTREAEEVIRRSNHTFVIASGFGVVEYAARNSARRSPISAATTSRA